MIGALIVVLIAAGPLIAFVAGFALHLRDERRQAHRERATAIAKSLSVASADPWQAYSKPYRDSVGDPGTWRSHRERSPW